MTPAGQKTLYFIVFKVKYELPSYFILHLHIIYLKHLNKLRGKYSSQQVLLSALRFFSVLYTGNVRRVHGNRDTNGV